jgi:hypothetical protein
MVRTPRGHPAVQHLYSLCNLIFAVFVSPPTTIPRRSLGDPCGSAHGRLWGKLSPGNDMGLGSRARSRADLPLLSLPKLSHQTKLTQLPS